MQTTKDPLVGLLQHIDCKSDEARDEQRRHAAYGGDRYISACGKVIALADVRKEVCLWIGEAANVSKPSPVVGSSAWVGDDGELRADAERAKKEWQAVELNGDSMSKRRSPNEIWLAAYMAGRRAHERKSPTDEADRLSEANPRSRPEL